jgi:hypothetical protein
MSFHGIGKIVLLLGSLAFGSGFLKANVTYGTFNAKDCFPFMCNNSGTSTGQSIDYQEVYAASSFSGPTTITGIDWYLDATDSGSFVNILGGDYTVYLGYAALNAVGNLSNSLANFTSGRTQVDAFTIAAGGSAYGPVLTEGPISFIYNPALGDLLMEIVVSNQDNIANQTGNGYNEADNSGTVVSRALCIAGGPCGAGAGGLVTTFVTAASTPEPGTLATLGGALLGLSLLRKQIFKA